MVHSQTLHGAERLYAALLLLYPRRFRQRFAREMAQLLRDCSRLTAETRGFAGLLRLWSRTLEDLAVSIPREWRREFCREDSEIDFTGLADLFMIVIVVGTLLLGWGWTGTVFVLALDLHGPAGLFASTAFRTPIAVILAGLITFVMAVLIGIVCAKFVARHGRMERRPQIKV